jgi:TetR/AcrR family transcriptional regulator
MQQTSDNKKNMKSRNRRLDILQALAKLLEQDDAERITTARLAASLKVSEAALYRYFPSKSSMYDALIDFVEESLLTLFASIREKDSLDALAKIHAMISVMLDFVEVNRGLSRVLTGHALVHEDSQLSRRIEGLYEKIETHLRQAYKEAVLANYFPADFNIATRANLVFCFVLGRWNCFVMSHFKVHANGVSPLTLVPFTMP